MVRKIIIAILFLFTIQVVFGQQNVKSIIRELKALEGGDRITAGKIDLDISERDDRINLKIKSVEVIEFRESKYPLFAEHFRNVLENLDDNKYEQISDSSRETILIRSKNDYIRELVVFRTGSRFGFIHIKGRVKLPDFWRELAEKLDVDMERAPRPGTPSRKARTEP